MLIEVVAQAEPASSVLGPLAVHLVVFLLAILLGFEVISKVPATLHTPLMSGSNAISGITIVGALLIAGGDFGRISTVFGFLAMVFATVNVVGGFLVTDRMLAMFSRK
ncbi:MAG: NAD(P) transhydrogenase subunit alpha [Planctomycetota bacterium]